MLRYCLDCTTAYAVDLTACPHCRSVRFGFTEPVQVADVIAGAIDLSPKKTSSKPAVPAPRRATP